MLFWHNLNSCVFLSAVSVDGCGPSSRCVSPIAVGSLIRLKRNQKQNLGRPRPARWRPIEAIVLQASAVEARESSPTSPGPIRTGARSPGVPMGPGLVLPCLCRARLRCAVCSCIAVRGINEFRASTADAYKTVAPIGLQLTGFKGTPPALASDGPAQKVGSDEPAAGGAQRS